MGIRIKVRLSVVYGTTVPAQLDQHCRILCSLESHIFLLTLFIWNFLMHPHLLWTDSIILENYLPSEAENNKLSADNAAIIAPLISNSKKSSSGAYNDGQCN